MKPLLKISKPTKEQVIKSVERVVGAFVVGSYAFWQLQPDKFSKATLKGAALAGGVAAYQVIVSFTTNL